MLSVISSPQERGLLRSKDAKKPSGVVLTMAKERNHGAYCPLIFRRIGLAQAHLASMYLNLDKSSRWYGCAQAVPENMVAGGRGTGTVPAHQAGEILCLAHWQSVNRDVSLTPRY